MKGSNVRNIVYIRVNEGNNGSLVHNSCVDFPHTPAPCEKPQRLDVMVELKKIVNYYKIIKEFVANIMMQEATILA